jgi:nicotinamidase-related amidase
MSVSPDLVLEPRRTALVVIDLQHGIVGRSPAPHSGPEVVARASALARALRDAGGMVVWVRVTSSPDGRDALQPPTDAPAVTPTGRPADWAELVPELDQQAVDLVVTKRQWGAFYGTELDLQLRRRGVHTIVLCGISTNIGVESTARDAYERGYRQVFVEDATSARSAEEHAFVMRTTFPRIGQVRSTAQVLRALGAPAGSGGESGDAAADSAKAHVGDRE